MRRRILALATPETWLFLALGGLATAVLAMNAAALSGPALVGVLAVAVAVAGLPHGALDPWLARRAGLWHTRWGLLAFNLGYVGLVALVVAVWLLAPGPSLVAFLAISAWHFGGDWRQHLPRWARVAAGAALIALPAWAWPTEVRAAFILLAGPQGGVVAGWLGNAGPWFAAGMAAAALVALRRSPAAGLELAAVAALALALPPLVFFIVYFCALHSVRHLRTAAHGADATARRRMAGVAALYTALTLLAAALAWPWIAAGAAPSAAPAADLLRLVFIGLAALTLPHMLVVMASERAQTGASA